LPGELGAGSASLGLGMPLQVRCPSCHAGSNVPTAAPSSGVPPAAARGAPGPPAPPAPAAPTGPPPGLPGHSRDCAGLSALHSQPATPARQWGGHQSGSPREEGEVRSPKVRPGILAAEVSMETLSSGLGQSRYQH
jgi:hypothetical protein